MVKHEIVVQRHTRYRGIPDDAAIIRWARAVLGGDRKPVTVCLRLVNAAESRDLNDRYRQRAYPTNVLSFPAGPMPPLPLRPLGDIVLCAPVIAREATAQHKPLLAHWAHMIVHGMLHLRGMDHSGAAGAAAMERREISILAKLGYPNPYEANQKK